MPLIVLGLAAAAGAYAGWRTRGAVADIIPGDADLATLLQLMAAAGLAGVAAGWWFTRS